MGIKSELHEAILKRGGKVPPYGGIAAAMDELNKLPGGGGDCDWNIMKNKPFGIDFTGEVLIDTTLDFSDGSGTALLSESIGLVVGETYSILYGTKLYESTAVEIEEMPGCALLPIGRDLMNAVATVVCVPPEMQEEFGAPAIVERSDMSADHVKLLICSGDIVVRHVSPVVIPSVEVAFTADDNEEYSASKTFKELFNAYSNGFDIRATVTLASTGVTHVLRLIDCTPLSITLSAVWATGSGTFSGVTVSYRDGIGVKVFKA